MGMIIKTKTGKIGHVIQQSGLNYICEELDQEYKKVFTEDRRYKRFSVKSRHTELIKTVEPWDIK